LLGGTRKSCSEVASSIIWSLRKSRLSISLGIWRDRLSSTKKARSHSSRKFAIMALLGLRVYVPLRRWWR